MVSSFTWNLVTGVTFGDIAATVALTPRAEAMAQLLIWLRKWRRGDFTLVG